MRVPDGVLKNVCFIAEVANITRADVEYDHWATGFFIGVQSERHPHLRYHYVVTAKHVADWTMENGRDVAFITNTKGGGAMPLTMAADRWFYHPTDITADVAVLPFWLDSKFDIVSLLIEDLMTPSMYKELGVGIGDEAFFPGLFTYAAGSRAIRPLLRSGNISMIPEEAIQVDGEFADVILVEGRSIGGLSGSPVVVRPTIGIPKRFFREVKQGEENLSFLGHTTRFYLLGLMRVHWDINKGDINKTDHRLDLHSGVNMGISIVVPAQKIIETLNHPDLVALREVYDRNFSPATRCTPDVPND